MRAGVPSAGRGVAPTAHLLDSTPTRGKTFSWVQRTTTIEERLRRALGDTLLTEEPLRHHTTFRIGGPADYYFAARTPEQLVARARRSRTRPELPDVPARRRQQPAGLGRRLPRARDPERDARSIEFDGTAAHVGCGADFLELIYQCRDRALAGPRVRGRHSRLGRRRALRQRRLLRRGHRQLHDRVHDRDARRRARRDAPGVVVRVRVPRLAPQARAARAAHRACSSSGPATRDEIQQVIDEKLEIRRVKHPQWRVEPTAGSYFKNLPPDWQMPGAKLSPGTRRVAGRAAARRVRMPRPARRRRDGVREAREHHRQRRPRHGAARCSSWRPR